MTTELNNEDLAYLEIGKIVDTIKDNLINIEEIWITTKPLDIRVEMKDEQGDECRYRIDTEKNSPLYFLMDGQNGKISTKDMANILLEKIPNMEEIFDKTDNIKFRLTAMEHFIEYARIKEFAVNLESNLEQEITTRKKMKL